MASSKRISVDLTRASGAQSAEVCRRLVDIAGAVAGLAIAAPLLAVAAIAILVSDGRPVLFRQIRLGQGGRRFHILKLRTMRVAAKGPSITAGSDPRVTPVGRLLRAYKLDELPQFWNVLKGEMSLVGPRPEVPEFVDEQEPLWRVVLSVKPGITDLATLLYCNEEQILKGVSNPERDYRRRILPGKLALNVDYLRRRSFSLDLKLMWWTARAILSRSEVNVAVAKQVFLKEPLN